MKVKWNEPCVVMASGPSLGFDNYADVELVRQSGLKVIVVNSTFEVAPWADVIYAGDSAWWKHHVKDVPKSMAKWSCSRPSTIMYGCSYRARAITPGFNSGANAVELAANEYGATQIILVGFDMSVKHGSHHHGDHPKTRNPSSDRCSMWKPQFKTLRERIGETAVVNCSRYSELPYFEKADLRETLKCARI